MEQQHAWPLNLQQDAQQQRTKPPDLHSSQVYTSPPGFYYSPGQGYLQQPPQGYLQPPGQQLPVPYWNVQPQGQLSPQLYNSLPPQSSYGNHQPPAQPPGQPPSPRGNQPSGPQPPPRSQHRLTPQSYTTTAQPLPPHTQRHAVRSPSGPLAHPMVQGTPPPLTSHPLPWLRYPAPQGDQYRLTTQSSGGDSVQQTPGGDYLPQQILGTKSAQAQGSHNLDPSKGTFARSDAFTVSGSHLAQPSPQSHNYNIPPGVHYHQMISSTPPPPSIPFGQVRYNNSSGAPVSAMWVTTLPTNQLPNGGVSPAAATFHPTPVNFVTGSQPVWPSTFGGAPSTLTPLRGPPPPPYSPQATPVPDHLQHLPPGMSNGTGPVFFVRGVPPTAPCPPSAPPPTLIGAPVMARPSASPHPMCLSPMPASGLAPTSPSLLIPPYTLAPPAVAAGGATGSGREEKEGSVEDIPDLRHQFLQSQMIMRPGQVQTLRYVLHNKFTYKYFRHLFWVPDTATYE